MNQKTSAAGAFNMTTGPAHWELLQRGRAIDNQLFVATCSPARNPDASYQAWGHSTVVSPWAQARRMAMSMHLSQAVGPQAAPLPSARRHRRQDAVGRIACWVAGCLRNVHTTGACNFLPEIALVWLPDRAWITSSPTGMAGRRYWPRPMKCLA